MNYLVNRGYRLDFLKTQIQRASDVSRTGRSLREGTFFLGGGEGWGILGFFSQKSVGPPLHFNENTPDPPPLGD